jgi:hypothetical protein
MNRYTLGRACGIVRKVDGSPGRLTVFSDIVRKNIVIRTVVLFYSIAPEFIKSYLLVFYGLKCYLSASRRGPINPDIVFFGVYPNERAALAHLRRRLSGFSTGDIDLSRGNCFRWGAVRALPAFFGQAPRWYRVARRLVRRFHFLPACRIFSTMTYYARFRQMLEPWDAKSVFVANHYSPECLALAAAAHSANRKVFCTNHANGTWRSGYVPPLHSDLVAVTSAVILDVYSRHSRRGLNSVFVPQAMPQRPMHSHIDLGRPVTIGIFLTALTNMERLQALVGMLESNVKNLRVLIRCHPVKVVNEDLSALSARGDHVTTTGDMPLIDNIGLCDVAICGNSSVTIDILRSGVPVLYDAGLDELEFDSNGYLGQQLVMSLPSEMNEAVFQSISRFYGDSAWLSTMRYFDAGYQQDEGAMFQELNVALRHCIQTALPLDAAAPVPGLAGAPAGA